MTITPDPQNPDDAMYVFVDTQPISEYPASVEESPSHFTLRQYIPTAISATFPIVVTLANHGLTNGQRLRATKFVPFPVAYATGMSQLNIRNFVVQHASTDTFELYDIYGDGIDGTGYTPYMSGGLFTLTGPTLPIVNPTNFPP